jgi:hypothetical protein
MSDRVTLKGRERELASLQRVLDADGPRVAFVYGLPGIGKSALLDAFAAACESTGTAAWRVDCAGIDPTEAGFRSALEQAGWQPGRPGVVLVDTYEVFRIADPWLRHELVPSLPPEVRFVIAGRDAPMLEWSTERGRLGGIEVLPLGGLTDEAAHAFLADANVAEDHAGMICRIARGHPLSLRLAAEADVAHMPIDDVGPRVVAALATAFRAGLDDEGRRLLDAASVPRRVTSGVLEAMACPNADDAIERLAALSFVDETSEGLRLHDAVQSAVSARLRALEPERFRELRSAAWRHLQDETRRAGASDLHRFTADLLFLIDNPFVREAMFPATTHAFSVERSRAEDAEALRALWHEFETPQGASVLDTWLRLRPDAVRSVRDRTGAVVGCSIVAEWRDIPPSLERADPVVAAWSRHAARDPLPPGRRTLTHRRWLAAGTGEGPSGVQAAALLDVKRDYFRLRPHLGRLYLGVRDPRPFLDALRTLGFRPFDEPIELGGEPFHLAALDFGPDSVDGWLNRLAAAELGEAEEPFLDERDRSVDLGGARIQLSPLEFGVLHALAAHPAAPVSRADLLREVWGTSYDGGSNTVDVVIRSLRRKLGPVADRIETVRGVGYRLR